MLDQFIVLAQETGQEAAEAGVIPPPAFGILAFAVLMGLLGITYTFVGLHASKQH